MSHTIACPDGPTLRRLLLGQVSDQEAEPLEEHLERCTACLGKLRALRPADALVEALGNQPATFGAPADEASAAQDLIRRLKALRPSAGTTGETPSPALTPSPESVPDRASTPVSATRPSGPDGSGPDPMAATLPENAHDFLAPAQQPGELGRLGPYRVLRVLGRGGMGVVFQAEDVHLKRQVALKVMRPEAAGKPAARERFLREAQAAAALEHEHVVTIYQVGAEGGVPFLAMQWLKGMSLEERLKRSGPLTVPQVLRLGRQTALGLAAAHARGLVHRDIKPANLWLEPEHGGRIRILDFGLARALSDEAHLTQSGAIVGTPAYMAPEQARGENVDHRCDLFSLGVVLYRMLTGQLPFRGDNTLAVLASLAMDTPPPPRQINPAVPAPLSELVVQLLAKDPAGRPQSAGEIASRLQALERGLAPPPVPAVTPPAEPPPRAIPVRPRVRRRLLVAVAVALLLAVAGGLLAEIIIRIKDKDGRTVAEVTLPAGAKAEVVKDGKVVGTLPGADQAKPPAVATQPEPPPLMGAEPLSPIALVQRPAEIKGVRSWTLETISHRAPVRMVAFSPDGRLLASGGDDGSIRVWKVDDGRLCRVLIGHGRPYWSVSAIAWSPDGKVLASGGHDRTIRFWEADSGKQLLSLQHTYEKEVYSLAWSPDGKTLAACGGVDSAGPVRLWEARSGEVLRNLVHPGVVRVAWSPDGKTIATGAADPGSPWVWDAASGKLLQTVKTSAKASDPGNSSAQFSHPVWSPDGKILAALHAMRGSPIRLSDPASGRVQRTLPGSFTAAAWSPDGKTLVTGEGGGFLRWWDPASGQLLRTVQAGERTVFAVAWARDGKTLASADDDGTVRFWDADKGYVVQTMAGHGDPGWNGIDVVLVWSRDGSRLMRSRSYNKSPIYLWDIGTNPPSANTQPPGLGLAWSQGSQEVIVSRDNDLVILDARTGKELQVLKGQTKLPTSAAWSPDGRLVASGGEDGARLWDPASAKLLHTWHGYKVNDLLIVAWSPDGKRLATGGDQDNAIRIVDVTTGKPTATIPTGPGSYTLARAWGSAIAWSPDGKKLATGVDKLYIWDTASGQKEDTYDAPPGDVVPLAWLTDGSIVAVTDVDRVLHVWDAAGRLTRTVRLPARGVLSPDRRLLASPGASATWLWDVESGRCQGTLIQLRNGRHLVLSADGHYTGSPRLERDLVYVVQTDQGQETLTPEEFATKYGWKNDPERVRLDPARAPK